MEAAAAIEDAVRLEQNAGTQTAANGKAYANAKCPSPASSAGWYRSRAIADRFHYGVYSLHDEVKANDDSGQPQSYFR